MPNIAGPNKKAAAGIGTSETPGAPLSKFEKATSPRDVMKTELPVTSNLKN